MATRVSKSPAGNSNGEHNVTSSAPFYVLYRSKQAGHYNWSQMGTGKYVSNAAAYPETPSGYETETAALEAIKAHKPGGYVYDYLIVRALSVVAVRPVVETVVTEVKL